jgi:hypothetical protein
VLEAEVERCSRHAAFTKDSFTSLRFYINDRPQSPIFRALTAFSLTIYQLDTVYCRGTLVHDGWDFQFRSTRVTGEGPW